MSLPFHLVIFEMCGLDTLTDWALSEVDLAQWDVIWYSVEVRNEILSLSSDETKIDLFGLSSRCHVWRKPDTGHQSNNTIPTVDSRGSARWWGLNGKLNKEQLKTWSRAQGLKLKIHLQQDNSLRRTAVTTHTGVI